MKCTAETPPEGFAWHRHVTEQVFLPHDVIAIEGLSFGSIGKTHLLSGAHAIWLEAAVQQGSCVFVPVPARVKIWATGSVKSTKPEMKAWARGELGDLCPKRLSEHEADALSLAQIAWSAHRVLNGTPINLDRKQLHILSNADGTGLVQNPDQSYFRGNNGKQRVAGTDAGTGRLLP